MPLRAAASGGEGGGATAVSTSSGREDRSGLSEEQLQAAAEQLMRLSRGHLQRPDLSSNTDDSIQQRMVLLLRLGFSQAAVEKAIKRRGGGPYIAEQHIGEAVALLRRWVSTQKQLDALLAANSLIFSRAPADLEDVLLWLQRAFDLQPSGVAKACAATTTLLAMKQQTLEANWRAFEAAFRPTSAAKTALATSMQQFGGGGCFLVLSPETARLKVGRLQCMLGLSDAAVSKKVGRLANLFGYDLGTIEVKFKVLQTLTGLLAGRLAPFAVQHPALLQYPEATLQRNYSAVLAAMGAADGRLLVQRRPDILISAQGRVAMNLRSLQQLGTTAEGARKTLLLNPRLALLNMQAEQPAARLRARLAFWQQAYGLPAGEAAVTCAEMLHRSLRTVAPRVAFYQQQRPGERLPHCVSFTPGDVTSCSRSKFEPAEFEAFKWLWLASEEGRAVCQHESKKSNS